MRDPRVIASLLIILGSNVLFAMAGDVTYPMVLGWLFATVFACGFLFVGLYDD